ncbi:hypothetical protein P43SY_006214 [Pythium insidiosum]|uniref:Pyruvate kinase n=1 Tax=Pythium insidiosum TaxID=114742 RepID=A0AAD5LXZ1_PYTIN|nr:hypothetical protein P43SY_006214 [Pythium insidiosum]
MSFRVHNAEHFEELRQSAIREQLAASPPTRPSPLSSTGRHSFGSPGGSLSPTITSKSFASELLRETQQKRVALKHELYKKEQEALQKKLADGIAENLQKQKTKREAQYTKLWRDVEEGKSLAAELHEKVSLQEQSRTRQFQRMHDEWQQGVFQKLNDPVVTKVSALDAKALNRHKHEAYQKFLDITNKKGGLFRDIIIESEYNPLQDAQCLAYRTKVDDPVKRVIRRREEEDAIVRDSAGNNASDGSSASDGLGRNDNLDVKLWSRGVFESTPYGYFHKMMGSRPTSESAKTHASRVKFDHYNIEYGADAVQRELPKGKRTNFEGYATIPKTTIELRLDSIMRSYDESTRKTKIVCTLGPSCWSQETLGELIDAGMNIARLNFSHGDHATHAETLSRLRGALASRPHKNVAVVLDTKGPEIRTGFLKNKDKVTIAKGSLVEWTTDYDFLGDETKIACSYKELPQSVSVGGKMLVADGSLVFTVVEVRENSVVARAENGAVIGERKNMNLPGAKVLLPTLTEKDEDDLVNFGLVQGVDFIAASFVRTGKDIENIRAVLGPRGRAIKIIAKIESQEGLENFDEILEKTDGIMVARGDLGMEIPPEKVFLAQKMMIRKANIAGKPVVTATQMLESMIKSPRPTRAECTDVANAVLDGTDCVMLSGETANGEYPVDAVQMMAKICVQAEGAIHYDELYQALRNSVLETSGAMSTQEAIASSAVKTAIDICAKMIVVLTETGTTARLISKYRPSQPILVLTALGETARQSEGFLKGTTARVMGSMIGTDSILYRATDLGKQFGWIKKGDAVVAIHGMQEARAGSTNMLKVLIVD